MYELQVENWALTRDVACECVLFHFKQFFFVN